MDIDAMLAYFDARYAVHYSVLSARRSVTQAQAEVGAALMAGQDFKRKYEMSVGDMVRNATR